MSPALGRPGSEFRMLGLIQSHLSEAQFLAQSLFDHLWFEACVSVTPSAVNNLSAKAGGLDESTNAASFEGLKLSSDGALIVEAQIFGGKIVFPAMHHVFVVLKLSNETNSSSSYVLLERTNTGIVCQYGMTQEQAAQLRAYGSTSPSSAWAPSWKAPPGAGVAAQGLYDFQVIAFDESTYHVTANNCRKFALVSDRVLVPCRCCMLFLWRRRLSSPLKPTAGCSFCLYELYLAMELPST